MASLSRRGILLFAAGLCSLFQAAAAPPVVAPPTISKFFGGVLIPFGGTTSLSFSITNPNGGTTLHGIGFMDSLPAGLVVATPNGLSGSCGGGTITATAASGSISLSGATLAASGSCTFSVTVLGKGPGVKTNTTSAVTSTEGGSGGTAMADVEVDDALPPMITKAFGSPIPVTHIPLGGTTTLNFTLTNPPMNGGLPLTGVGFTDTLPGGLVVSTPNGLSGSCGGGTITAVAGSGSISLSGATLAAACFFSVSVTGTSPGLQVNTTGFITSTESGPGGTATATLLVVAPPIVSKFFGPASIPVGGTTALTFTIVNPNATPLFAVGFTDPLPAGLVVGAGGILSNTCFLPITAAPGSSTITIPPGATLPPSTSCTVVVTVHSMTAGVKTNTTSAITSDNGGTGNTATATLTVVAPPTISKAFGAAFIPLGSTTSLTFTITNPNATKALTGVGFTDTLPAGLVVAPDGANSCGGTVTAVVGLGSISLSGGSLAASGSCTILMSVTGTTASLKTNTTSAVTSTEGGTGNVAIASITVFDGPDVTISKSHSGSFVRGEEGAQYRITVSNIGTKPTSGTVTVTDTLPTGLTATAISGTGWACVLATLTCTRSDALGVGNSYPPIIVTVNVSLSAALMVTNTVTVSGGGDLNPTNNTATDPTTVIPCAAHTVHFHVTTTPPDAHNGDSHIHHGQHDHNILPGTECLPPGHHFTVAGHILGLTPESQDGLFSRDSLAAPGPDFVAILNQDGNPAPAQRGTVIQLFGSANGFFFDSADQEPVLRFRPPASGLPLYYTTSLPEVLIGEVPGEVLFSGLAPGLEGVWQINVRIPDGVSPGKIPVTILYEGGALRSVDVSVE